MDHILEVINVNKSYANHQALKEVSLSVPRQSIYGLLGPNGAGKTSLIRIVTQIIGRDSGEILFKGAQLVPSHVAQIGYLPEERGLYRKMKVGEQLLYLAQLKGLTTREAKQKLKVWFDKFDIKTWWNKAIADLSKGMQQKIQFVATVLHEPDLIILDEPFSGFDPVNANLIKDEILKLRDNGSTIIFSTHRMESVEELCDHIALINKSEKILEGPKHNIKNTYKSNTFIIQYEGELNGVLPSRFNVLGREALGESLSQITIRTSANDSPNDVLSELIQHVQVHSFQEKIPSMNDIFISLVSGKEL